MMTSLGRFCQVFLDKFRSLLQSDGMPGLIEKIFAYAWKKFWTFYYRFRFRRFGAGSVVTGPLSISGGKWIEVGEEVVIEGGTSLRVSEGGRIRIGDRCFLEAGVRLISKGELILGEKVYVLKDASVVSGGQVRLEDRVWVASGSSIGGQDVILEHDVIVGPQVFVMDGDHEVNRTTGEILMHGGRRRSVRIKTNAWLGARSIVLKGVTVGEGAIVGAGSVVTKDIPPHALAVGVPAEVRKSGLLAPE